MYLMFQAVTTPSMAVSHIMLEAYKKYILVVLILQGKVRPFILQHLMTHRYLHKFMNYHNQTKI